MLTENKNTLYPHLGKEALLQIDLSDEDRVFAILSGTWINYPRAKEILARMEELLQYPRIDRMPNMLIVGASNSGKSNLLHHFERNHKPDPNLDGEYAIVPVLFVEAPKKPDVNDFYNRILEAIWQPYAIRSRDSNKASDIKQVLRNVQLKVLLLDELQHIIAGGPVKQREFRNALKSLGNELKISIVCAGVEESLNAFNTDPQMSNRFEPEFLPRWNFDNEYGDLLESFEKRIPLKKPSNLRADIPLAQKILWMSEGLLGEIHEILKRAAKQAIKDKSEQITLDTLSKFRWTMPSKRKTVSSPS